MQAKVHTEMALQVITDYPNKDLYNFLFAGVAKADSGETDATRIQWMKEWMDMPDNKTHHSKMDNDHSYKIEKAGNGFKIKFLENHADQATVIARLKYAARDIDEWDEEEEYRVCAIELLKSIHWVIDMSTPPHTLADWDAKSHDKIETHFDSQWKSFYDKNAINWKGETKITDIYLWAKGFVEGHYDRNENLLNIYKAKGSILKDPGQKLGRDVITDVAQNMADYFLFTENRVNIKKMLNALKA